MFLSLNSTSDNFIRDWSPLLRKISRIWDYEGLKFREALSLSQLHAFSCGTQVPENLSLSYSTTVPLETASFIIFGGVVSSTHALKFLLTESNQLHGIG